MKGIYKKAIKAAVKYIRKSTKSQPQKRKPRTIKPKEPSTPRWSMKMIDKLEPGDYEKLNVKELKAIDRALTQSVNKKLKSVHQATDAEGIVTDLGISPAEIALRRSGISINDAVEIGKSNYITALDSDDKDSLIEHIDRLNHFRELKTATRRNFKRYLDWRERITRDRGVSVNVFDVVEKLKKEHRFSEAVALYAESSGVIEAIENIIDTEFPETVDEVVGRLFGTWEAENRINQELEAYEEMLKKYGVNSDDGDYEDFL